MPADGAAYRVVFESDKGEIFSGAVAHVRPKKDETKDQPATFVSPLQDTTIPVGETLTLKCQVSGEPMPTTVKWYRNGEGNFLTINKPKYQTVFIQQNSQQQCTFKGSFFRIKT